MRGWGVDYSGRQLDVELLSHVEKPSDQTVNPHVDEDDGGPCIVAGMEKVVQRYANLFLTESGSVKFNEDIGGSVLGDIRAGIVQSESYLSFIVTEADRKARDAMMADDEDETFGTQPDDEKLESTEIVSIGLDDRLSKVSVHVRLVTRAGSEYNFVVPVRTGTTV